MVIVFEYLVVLVILYIMFVLFIKVCFIVLLVVMIGNLLVIVLRYICLKGLFLDGRVNIFIDW